MRKREKEKQKAPSPMRLQGKTDKFRLHARKTAAKAVASTVSQPICHS